MLDKHKFNDKKELRRFSLGLAVILLIITAWMFWKNDTLNIILPALAGLAVLTGLIRPLWIKPLFIPFSYFAFGMNLAVTYVILFLLFFGIFTPVGLIMRLFGKKPLETGFRTADRSYWIDRPEDQRRDGNFEKQF